MSGKRAKQLKALASEIAFRKFNRRTSVLLSSGGMVYWDAKCPKGIYKQYKKLYIRHKL